MAHQYAGVRALFRTVKIPVLNAFTGQIEDLKTKYDTVVDLDNAYNRRSLERHSAIHQWYITALNNTLTVAASGTILTTLPANSPGAGSEPSNEIP